MPKEPLPTQFEVPKTPKTRKLQQEITYEIRRKEPKKRGKKGEATEEGNGSGSEKKE